MNVQTVKPRCKAKATTTGKPCQKYPIKGSMVCRKHGGAAPQVRAKAAERLADLIDPDRALREAAKIAYGDLTLLLDDDGRVKPKSEWPESMRGVVSAYETETLRGNVDEGDGKFDPILKTRLRVWDKPKALDMLFRHLALYNDETKVTVKGDVELIALLEAGRKRLAS